MSENKVIIAVKPKIGPLHACEVVIKEYYTAKGKSYQVAHDGGNNRYEKTGESYNVYGEMRAIWIEIKG